MVATLIICFGELQKTQKEIDLNKKEKLDKAKRKSRGMSR